MPPSFAVKWPDHVYMLLLSSHRENVLMVQDDGQLNLPYYEYEESRSRNGDIQVWCEDLRDWFPNLPSSVYFTGVVELLGEVYSRSSSNQNRFGLTNLILMEPHGIDQIEHVELCPNATWVHAAVVKSMIETFESSLLSRNILDIVLRFTKPFSQVAILDPRYQLGWFAKASEFLIATVSSDGADTCGPVSQEQVSVTSTLLAVESASGMYFLKSPKLGCNEVSITAQVAELFPKNSPQILACSDSLNCFVSKGFTHVSLESENARDVVLQLGRLQLESLQFVDKLMEAGCPVRDLKQLEQLLEQWADDEDTEGHFMAKTEDIRRTASVIASMCRRLDNFKIPLTLAHGDAGLSNATFNPPESPDIMFFDWEFGHIGHPFCDLHRLHKHISEEVLDEYLQLWSSYVDIERGREAVELACKLGWAVKSWAIMDCEKACNAQQCSSLEAWAESLILTVPWPSEMPNDESS